MQHNVCYCVQEDYAMMNGVVAEAGSSFMLLPRYMCLSEDHFSRPNDFVPER